MTLWIDNIGYAVKKFGAAVAASQTDSELVAAATGKKIVPTLIVKISQVVDRLAAQRADITIHDIDDIALVRTGAIDLRKTGHGSSSLPSAYHKQPLSQTRYDKARPDRSDYSSACGLSRNCN